MKHNLKNRQIYILIRQKRNDDILVGNNTRQTPSSKATLPQYRARTFIMYDLKTILPQYSK